MLVQPLEILHHPAVAELDEAVGLEEGFAVLLVLEDVLAPVAAVRLFQVRVLVDRFRPEPPGRFPDCFGSSFCTAACTR